MLICVSATVQAEIVHHGVCQPTSNSRGFTRECWEDTETGKFYADASRMQELVNEELAKAVIYAKLQESPVISLNKFSYGGYQNKKGVDFNYSVTTTYDNDDREVRSAEFLVTGDNVANARLVWYKENTRQMIYGAFYVRIFVNGEKKMEDTSNSTSGYIGDYDASLLYVHSLPELKKGDVVRFEIQKLYKGSNDRGPIFKASLEYTGTFDDDDSSPIVRHTVQEPTTSACGYTKMCWENKNTGKYYSDEACSKELTDEALAKTVIYAKFPESPITDTYNFAQSEHEIDWDVNLNWAGVTTYYKSNNVDGTPRWVKFTASTPRTDYLVTKARLVWNRNYMARVSGIYHVRIFVNDVEKFSRDQANSGDFEGVFVLNLPELKAGDVVRFEVNQKGVAAYNGGEPVFKASLEYNIVPCTHEYSAGSAICSLCGYVKPHTHTYNPVHECTQCGYFDESSIFMSGDLGDNIKWRLFNDWTLYYYGTGEMEPYNEAHNAWRNNSSIDVKKIVIGEGITKIGDGDSSGDGYFSSQWSLLEVVLPSTLKTIGSIAFKSSPLASITLPEGLETVGYQAFYYSYLPSVVIPESVTTIAQEAFFINQLHSVTLKGSPTIGSQAFGAMEEAHNFYLMSAKPVSANADIFNANYISIGTLHVNNDLYDWATTTNPWKNFGKIVPLQDFNIEYTDAENNNSGKYFDKEASDNTFTLTDGAFKNFTIKEDIPMQTLTYTRNFSAANTWQALYVPFEMQYSDWSEKFDVAAISNFHEYTNENGETEKVELEVRNVKSGKLRANTPYLIRAKAAGMQSIEMNDVTLKATEAKSIDCRSTEREYTFTGTYDAIDGLQTKDYIFVSGGSLCKANNDTDVLKPMRWYLTIENRQSMTYDPSPAFAKPMSIRMIGEEDATGIEAVTIVSTPAESKSSGIYSITGTKLAKPQKGVNIIDGKKIVR